MGSQEIPPVPVWLPLHTGDRSWASDLNFQSPKRYTSNDRCSHCSQQHLSTALSTRPPPATWKCGRIITSTFKKATLQGSSWSSGNRVSVTTRTAASQCRHNSSNMPERSNCVWSNTRSMGGHQPVSNSWNHFTEVRRSSPYRIVPLCGTHKW